MSPSQQPIELFPILAKIRQYIRPEIFEYYELRSQGLRRARAYEEWQVEALVDEAHHRMIARRKVKARFRHVQWDTGFWSEEAREMCRCEECKLPALGREREDGG